MRHRRCTCDRFYTNCKSIHQEYEQSIAADPDKLGLSVRLPEKAEPSKRSWEVILEESLRDFTNPLINLFETIL